MTPGSPVASNRSRYSPVPDKSVVLRPGTLENEYVMVPEATNRAWPRSSMAAARSTGRTTSSPGASRESARCPGPCATLRTNGKSPRSRFAPPGVSMTDMGTVSSFQSMAWCSKKTESAASSASSATGTMSPSIWTVLDPKWISVRSRRRGAWRHPASLTRSRWSSGAPQRSQLRASREVVGVAPLALDPLSDVSHEHPPRRSAPWRVVGSAHPSGPGQACHSFGVRLPPPAGHPRAMSDGLHVASSLVTLTLPRTSSIEIASRGRVAVAGGP